MKIVVKESKPNESEFLVYLMDINNRPLICKIAKNNKEKIKAIKNIISENNIGEYDMNNMNYKEYITQK